VIGSLRGLPDDERPIIVGAGLAGLLTALCLAPRPVLVLAGAPLGEGTASSWSQGGLAAAVGPDDSPALHLQDTINAGDGLCAPAMAARVVAEGAEVVARLLALGVVFDREPSGALHLGLEAAHGRRRIVHAADATGAALMQALINAVRRSASVLVVEGVQARRLNVSDNVVHGVTAIRDGRAVALRGSRVVLATGGIGGLFAYSTNPRGAIGLGLAMAARAGAELADMEFVQFHPTALDIGADPMPLVSEAVRGEGAILVDETGTRFMAGLGRAELEPRDIVARAVWRHIQLGHRAFVDARSALGSRFAERFPAIAAACRGAGIDPTAEPIPIRPAAHFHMGGVATDATGRSSVDGLWAAGEVACTGLHGANRLASNSLLEAAAMAGWVAQDVAGHSAAKAPGRLVAPQALVAPDAGLVRPILSAAAGVLRNGDALSKAADGLSALIQNDGAASDPALVAWEIVTAAQRRTESRGSHFRTDHPARDIDQGMRRSLQRREPDQALLRIA
jgi:L-aspartate oxidase